MWLFTFTMKMGIDFALRDRSEKTSVFKKAFFTKRAK